MDQYLIKLIRNVWPGTVHIRPTIYDFQNIQLSVAIIFSVCFTFQNRCNCPRILSLSTYFQLHSQPIPQYFIFIIFHPTPDRVSYNNRRYVVSFYMPCYVTSLCSNPMLAFNQSPYPYFSLYIQFVFRFVATKILSSFPLHMIICIPYLNCETSQALIAWILSVFLTSTYG